jgi:hypothetical protein
MNKTPTFAELQALPGHAERARAEEEELAGLWAATSPEVDTEVGVIRDLVVRPAGESAALVRQVINETRLNMSMHEMAATGVPADDDRIDVILQNFPAYKRRGTEAARLTLAMIRSTDTILSLPMDSVFVCKGLRYYTETTYTATPIRVNTDNDRLLSKRTDGLWMFTFPVLAEGPGEKYNLKANSEFEWEGADAEYVRIYAVSDAAGGRDPETTGELLLRMDEYMSVPGIAGRMNIKALIRREFPSTLDISLIGGGDPEMQRDSRNMLNMKTGGRTDMYVRTSRTSTLTTEQLKGELVDPVNHVVRIKVGKDVYPGFYAVRTVRRAADSDAEAALSVFNLEYGMDVSGMDYDVPLLPRVVDSRFTRFQTLDLYVVDPRFDPDRDDYLVSLIGMPAVGEIQDFVSRRDVRGPNDDILVRAAIPYHVVVNATVRYYPGTQGLDADKVREDIMTAVGDRRFQDGSLSSLLIGSEINSKLPSGAEAAPPLELFGAVDLPDGSYRTFRSTLELVPPTDASLGVSPRTVAFLPYDAVVDLKLLKGTQI